MSNQMMKHGIDCAVTLTAGLCAGGFLIGSGVAQAEEAKAPEKKKGWETVGSVGVTLTRGNSETFMATFGINSTRKWSKDEILLGASAGYGETATQRPPPQSDDHTKTAQFAKAFAQWNHLFTERLYGGVRADGLYDEIAGVDYRATVGPMVGYYVIKNPTTFLAFEAGPSAVFERLAGEDSDIYFILRFADRFEHKFTERTKIWQTAEYMPQVDRFSNYIVTFEAGISSAINSHLDLRVVFTDIYRNEPPAGRKNNDIKLVAGVGYTF
jgi:putative salt-induced outer membrane protein YdiY